MKPYAAYLKKPTEALAEAAMVYPGESERCPCLPDGGCLGSLHAAL